jgi:hypothetical protein
LASGLYGDGKPAKGPVGRTSPTAQPPHSFEEAGSRVWQDHRIGTAAELLEKADGGFSRPVVTVFRRENIDIEILTFHDVRDRQVEE